MSRPRRPLAVLLAAAGCLAACAALSGCTTYDTAYDYGSRPSTKPVGDVGSVDARILGIREGGSSGPAAVDVRVRVERAGSVPVAMPPGNLRLLLGNGDSVDVGDVRALGPAVPAAGGASAFQVSFPLPGRDPAMIDVSRLNLVVALDVAGRRETVTLPFERGVTNIVWADPWGWPGTDFNGRPTGWRGDGAR